MVMPTEIRIVMVALCAAGCGSGIALTDGGGGPPQDCTGLPKNQTVSQSCCAGFGADACGAGLFCAAFDGRTQPSCYVEHTRRDQESCTADIQCVSGSCNPMSGAAGGIGNCRSLPGSSCSVAIGCADDLQGQSYRCDSTCKARGHGLCQEFCQADSDCQSGVGMHCDLSTQKCAIPLPTMFQCQPDPRGDTCAAQSQKCVTYGVCGPTTGGWMPSKACLDATQCAAGEVCHHGGAIPCSGSFCL